ncbi:hypothetical protein BU24DRAFT_488988 [Aaosphaeria arxii CBS 175.79]|uniref:RRM domain-containing protein n=1 Tax=Aaosphaeria arxii CBS 175.79 TaxID=1450172 RepID=A0A6A5Y274_9PLEO|nr:uncharacterized protein BU24DRAFT_488988 [Aaosphaeria arxii CBS 175.79]KAF2018930.1 hypothetical protein BU24DRAFT_488988 [Aaosphaeria arxii CBS 175.79]
MAPQAGANGVLPASVLQKNAPTPAPRGPKAASPRLKLVLRRLPPGLTKAELDQILGDEWKVGGGKIDWLSFREGKISKDLAKPSRPARAYIHVTSHTIVPILGDHVRSLTFHDAAKSFQDNALVGPPALEFAPFHKLPAGKKKQDNRQGTIDQDPDFQAFLVSLTNPIAKPIANESDDKKDGKVTTTPLIEALREKKANKEKPQTKSGKHGRGEAKEETEKKILSKGKDAGNALGDKSRRATKAEKAAAAKESVKILNKAAGSSKDASTDKAAASPAPERKRGNASIAKSIIQRDLGGGAPSTRRRGTKRETPSSTQDAPAQTGEPAAGKQKAKDIQAAPASTSNNTTEKAASSSSKKERPSRAERRAFKASLADKTNTKNAEQESEPQSKAAAPAPKAILKKTQPAQIPAAVKGPATSRSVPTEPAAARAALAKNDANTRQQNASPAQPTPAATSRQAFLKHANPSQGITEPLIEEALKIFGRIEKVEIDKRKGFAYVDFSETEALKKAISASPIKVAQGAVQVLERKEKATRAPPTGPARGRSSFPNRGRGRGGARGGAAATPSTSAPTPTTAPTT